MSVKTAGRYTATKVGRYWHVKEIGNDEVICYLNNKEIDSWLFRTVRADAEISNEREIRMARVKAYLETRKTRKHVEQLSFGF